MEPELEDFIDAKCAELSTSQTPLDPEFIKWRVLEILEKAKEVAEKNRVTRGGFF